MAHYVDCEICGKTINARGEFHHMNDSHPDKKGEINRIKIQRKYRDRALLAKEKMEKNKRQKWLMSQVTITISDLLNIRSEISELEDMMEPYYKQCIGQRSDFEVDKIIARNTP